MGIDDDDILMKALDGDGIGSIPDLLILDDGQIDRLFFNDGTGKKLVPLVPRNKLRVLRHWNFHLQQVQGTRKVDWMDQNTVNEDTWDEFRTATYLPSGVTNVAPSPAPRHYLGMHLRYHVPVLRLVAQRPIFDEGLRGINLITRSSAMRGIGMN